MRIHVEVEAKWRIHKKECQSRDWERDAPSSIRCATCPLLTTRPSLVQSSCGSKHSQPLPSDGQGIGHIPGDHDVHGYTARIVKHNASKMSNHILKKGKPFLALREDCERTERKKRKGSDAVRFLGVIQNQCSYEWIDGATSNGLHNP